jgi:hypothetical protein
MEATAVEATARGGSCGCERNHRNCNYPDGNFAEHERSPWQTLVPGVSQEVQLILVPNRHQNLSSAVEKITGFQPGLCPLDGLCASPDVALMRSSLGVNRKWLADVQDSLFDPIGHYLHLPARLFDPSSGLHIHGQTNTGVFASVSTLFVTLPMRSNESPLRPCDDMAMRSQPLSSAAAMMA